MDEVNDARLMAIAAQRIEQFDPAKTVSGDALYAELGITKEDLDRCGEVEIE